MGVCAEARVLPAVIRENIVPADGVALTGTPAQGDGGRVWLTGAKTSRIPWQIDAMTVRGLPGAAPNQDEIPLMSPLFATSPGDHQVRNTLSSPSASELRRGEALRGFPRLQRLAPRRSGRQNRSPRDEQGGTLCRICIPSSRTLPNAPM